MKKIATVFIAFALMLSMAACSGQGSEQTGQEIAPLLRNIIS